MTPSTQPTSNSQTILYFAYGSNVSSVELRRHCPSAKIKGTYLLKDHRLAFTRHSPKRGCGVADILPEKGAEVIGIVYEIDNKEMAALDKKEAVASGGYKRCWLSVVPLSDKNPSIQAVSYTVVEKSGPYLPNAHYMDTVLEGAAEHQIPEIYVARLRQVETA